MNKISCAFSVIGILLVATFMSGLSYAEEDADSFFTLPAEAMQANPNVENQKIYVKPGADLGQYRSVLIEPLCFIHKK